MFNTVVAPVENLGIRSLLAQPLKPSRHIQRASAGHYGEKRRVPPVQHFRGWLRIPYALGKHR